MFKWGSRVRDSSVVAGRGRGRNADAAPSGGGEGFIHRVSSGEETSPEKKNRTLLLNVFFF